MGLKGISFAHFHWLIEHCCHRPYYCDIVVFFWKAFKEGLTGFDHAAGSPEQLL
jgi:hypothetical protein